jgi:hypothetical protein
LIAALHAVFVINNAKKDARMASLLSAPGARRRD